MFQITQERLANYCSVNERSVLSWSKHVKFTEYVMKKGVLRDKAKERFQRSYVVFKKSQPTILEGNYSVRDCKFFPTTVIA